MKVCLIIPPRPYLLSQKALPNLGILTVSAVAKQLGCEVDVLDFADGWRFVEADLHGIYVSTPDFDVSVSILKWLKQNGAQKVVAGGPHPTLMPEECLEAGFDAVSVGDGEVTFPKILEGERIAVGWLEDIDKAPHPDRTCLNLKEYTFKIDGQPATSMMTTYGCVWGRCAFCCRAPYNKARFHSIRWVQKELDEIIKASFKSVMIYDDEFFTYPTRDLKIIKTLGRCEWTWRAFAHSRFLLRSKEVVYEAARNGLREVLLGIESGSDQILQTIDKGTTVEMNKQAIQMLNFLGVNVKCAMIVMLPEESQETLKQTWAFSEEMEPYVKDWDFTLLVPYPGSRIYEHPELFDIKFGKSEAYKAYKGSGTESWDQPKISTSKLSFQEGLKWRDALEQRFKFKKRGL